MLKNSISMRGVTSLFIAITLTALMISGAALFIAPPCSVAGVIGWSFAGLPKSGWETIHVIMAISFVILSLIHVFAYNFKALKGYIVSPESQRFRLKKEALAALIIAFILISMAAVELRPFSALMDYQDRIKDSYRESVDWNRGYDGSGPGRGMGRGRY